LNIVFRSDASLVLGSGHTIRCLTLAEQLRAQGARVTFLQKNAPGDLIDFIKGKGYRVYSLKSTNGGIALNVMDPDHGEPSGESWREDARQTQEALVGHLRKTDWLVVDHYNLDRKWETQMKSYARHIMVIDDLFDRPHDCNLLLDQNLHKPEERPYSGLVPESCKLLLGTRFALLRPEFSKSGKNLRSRDGSIRRLFIYFGAVDPENLTGRALEAFKMLADDTLCVDIVVGEANPRWKGIREECNSLSKVTLHGWVDNIEELMSQADLAIGAGGTTTWERCRLGLPTLIVSIARNQDSNSENMGSLGAAVFLGRSSQVTEQRILEGIQKCLQDKSLMISMSEKGRNLVDGGGCDRVIAEMNLS